MAVSINWGTKIIYIPQADLTPKGGVLYELDVDWFRLQLKNLEDSEAGMAMLDTHRHTTETNLSGVTYARFVEIINGYTVEFEDGQYTVSCIGANHNLADVKVANQVSLIIGNAAGLIRVETGVSGLTPEESDQLMALPQSDEIADAVWEEDLSEHDSSGTTGRALTDVKDEALGKWVLDPVAKTLTLYRENDTIFKIFDLVDTGDAVPTFVSRDPR